MNITSASDVAYEIQKQTESKLLAQLGWLVSRGLLTIESSEPALVQSNDGVFEIKQTVELKVKDKEYIELLEKKLELAGKEIKLLKDSRE